ncbi:Beaten path [Danaus plexippus plexippus]|uniref:Beaten path n=1 Tax=Danaus plexippus plexippus TaxID=278856 RepID=A0A212EK22_DANPL|nr:Beaten path [Danaus plexippus plexippus]
MMIPEAVERGKPAVIKCMYDLEKEDLYQVKWYRGDREFCRYSPRDVPPLKVFPISGIDVDRDASDAKQVTIKAATKRAHGRYTCEVSADAPSFLTAQMHGFMHVVGKYYE